MLVGILEGLVLEVTVAGGDFFKSPNLDARALQSCSPLSHCPCALALECCQPPHPDDEREEERVVGEPVACGAVAMTPNPPPAAPTNAIDTSAAMVCKRSGDGMLE